MSKVNKYQTLRRVKVYILSDAWVDSGTGYCAGEISDDQSAYLVVKSEQNQEEELLKAKIEGSIQFQRQQDTLIVWTDVQGQNFALSFQEKEGCAALCEFIIKVHRENISPEISLVSVISNDIEGDITELIAGPIQYPPATPQSSDLVAILNCFNENPNSMYYKQSISNFIKENKFIGELIRLFYENENNRKIKNLHLLCNIIKTLILFNESSIIDLILDDENLMGVVGILEYDPEYPKFKSNHRVFLKDDSKFKEIVPLKNDHVEKLIKKTYILQFLKDVVLARLLDDPTFNLISSTIHFNQIEIIEFLIKDEFISDLFTLYQTTSSSQTKDDVLTPTNDSLQRKRDGIKLLHQFVLMAKSLQPMHKTKFFKSLIKRGLLKTIDFILHDDSVDIRVYGTEIIVAIIDHDVLIINGIEDEESKEINNCKTKQSTRPDENGESFELKDYEKESDGLVVHFDDEDEDYNSEELDTAGDKVITLSSDMTLMLVLTKFLLEDKNPGLRIQAFEALKSLLDPVSSICNPSMIFGASMEDNEKENGLDTNDYFKAFYEKVAPLLFEPIIDLKDEDDENEKKPIEKSTQYDDELFIHLCELINFCAKDKVISRSFFLENHILLGISRLIKPTHKLQLRLAALRTLKCTIQLNDDYYTRYLIQENIFNEVFNLLAETDGLVNLAYSTILNLFEIILIGLEKLENRKNFRLLANHIVTNFKDYLLTIKVVDSGKDLIKVVEEADSSSLTIKEDEQTTNHSEDDLDRGDIDGISDHEILTEPLQEEDVISDEIPIKESQANGESKSKLVAYQEVQSHLIEGKENRAVDDIHPSASYTPVKVTKSPSTPTHTSVIYASPNTNNASPSTKRVSEDHDHDLNRSDVKRKFTLKEKFANASKKFASKFSGNRNGNEGSNGK